MNKVFKVIWSEARNAYVVVSEIAKNMGSKSCSTKKLLAMLIATGVMTCAGMAPAMAATNLAPNETQILIGKDASVEGLGDKLEIAIGNDAKVYTHGVSIGFGTMAASESVAIGDGAITEKYVGEAIAIGKAAHVTATDGIAFGTRAQADGRSIAIGEETGATGQYSICIGPLSKTGSNTLYATAIGTRAEATADDANAIGHKAQATGVSAVALGKEANASANYATAIGTLADVTADYANAIGYKAQATGESAVALGKEANASADYATALGALAKASGISAFAIGYDSQASGKLSVALGTSSRASGEYSVVLGTSSKASGEYAIAVGVEAYATEQSAVALGSVSEASAANAIAIGYKAKANAANAKDSEEAANAIAIGNDAEATNANTAAIGYNAEASGENAAALGDTTIASGKNSIALGHKAEAIGEDATALGDTANAHEVDSTALGAYASTEGGVGATAVGYHSEAIAKESTAIGNNSKATITGSVALGSYSEANRDAGSTGYLAPNAENIKSDRIWTANKAAVSVGSSTTTRQIINVAAGEYDTDAVNVAQLMKVNEAAQAAKTVINPGDNVTITSDTDAEDGHTIYTISATDTKYTAGNGIKIDSNNNNAISVKLKDNEQNLVVDESGLSLNQNLNVTSVTTGNTVINNNGLSVGGKTYVSNNGLNANGQKITNVADGTEDGDAVNYGQIKAIEQTAGKGWNVSTNGGTATKVAPGDTVDFAGDSNVSVSNEGTSVKVALKNDINVNSVTTNNAYVTNVDASKGNSVTNVEYVNKQIADSALSAGNGIDITNKVVSVKLKEGEKNLVVDESGLSLNQDISVNKVTTNNAYVTNVDASNGNSVTNVDYVKQQAAAAKTEVKAGTNVASVTETKGTNGQTIYTVNAKDTTVSGDSNISATAEDKGSNVTNYKLQLASDLTGISSISNGSSSIKLTNGNVVVNNKVTIDGNGKISGVADGAVTSTSTDVVNGSQLYKVQQEAGKHSKVEAGTNINVDAKEVDGQMVYKVNLNSDILLQDSTGQKYVHINGNDGTIESTGSITTKDRVYADKGGKLADIDVSGNKISNGSSSIVMDGSNVKVNDKVTIDQTGKISGVVDGEISDTSTDAINGSQLNDTNNRVTNVENRVTTIEGDVKNIKNDITTIKGDITTINNKVDANTQKIEKNTQDITKLDDRVTEVEKVAGKHSTVTQGDNITVTESTNSMGGTDYKVSVNKDINLNSVTTGDTVMNNDGLKVGDKVSVTKDAVTAGNTSISNDGLKIGDKTYVNSDGLNANSQKLTNVADGEISATSKDAVNGSQLHATNEQVIDNSNRISKLGNRINKVGAGAAALAALHPMDFDPDDKWSFAAGYGNYAGENAAAIGAYYRPDEKVMFSVGGTVGNGENMVNAGISFALDRTNHVSNSRTALAREVIDLRGQLAEMGAKMAKMEAMLGVIDESKTKLFPDVPANHWAYEYIAKLAGNGILEGYPDGTFGGDRLMTRYEFAAMLYRAIEKGAALEERIINEFAPELGRIRVDRISGKDSDRNKIERVRVNGPRSERDHYGSKLK